MAIDIGTIDSIHYAKMGLNLALGTRRYKMTNKQEELCQLWLDGGLKNSQSCDIWFKF